MEAIIYCVAAGNECLLLSNRDHFDAQLHLLEQRILRFPAAQIYMLWNFGTYPWSITLDFSDEDHLRRTSTLAG